METDHWKPWCRASTSLLLSSSVGNRLPVGSVWIIRLCWKAILLLWRTDPGYLFSLPCYDMLTVCYTWWYAFVLSTAVKPFLLFFTMIICKSDKSHRRSKQCDVVIIFSWKYLHTSTGTVMMKNILRNNLKSFTVQSYWQVNQSRKCENAYVFTFITLV